MGWYYKTFAKVGRLRVIRNLVLIEIDGYSVHSLPVSDVLGIISYAVQIPLNPEDISEGIGSLSKSQLGLKFNTPVEGLLCVVIVWQVLNMIRNPEKKSALWVPVI